MLIQQYLTIWICNMKSKKCFNKVINYLNKKEIPYSLSWDKKMLFIFKYPKDVRIIYTDVVLTTDFKIISTNIYRYKVSWIIWNDRNMKQKTLSNQKEVLCCLNEIVREFRNDNYIQEKLEL